MYAIVRTGGKQYRVEEGRAITVERLPAEEGSTVELGEVLLIADDGEVTIGTPLIEGARVLAQVETNGRAKKIIVFKYRAKVRTRKKTGHRQAFSRLAVTEILRPGQQPKDEAKPEPSRRQAAPAKAKAEAPAAAKAAEATPAAEEASVTEPPPAPKRRPTRTTPTPAPPATTKPKARRSPRKKAGEETGKTPEAEAPEASKTPDADASEAGETKPKARRSPRKKTGEETE